jgi:hypothetical protein
MSSRLLFVTIIMITSGLFSCSHFTAKETQQDIIKKYERLVLERKADSISQLFTTAAEIGHARQPPIKGRDSIYAFLSSFKNVHVLNNRDSISTTSIKNDSAIVTGIYRQTVIISGKDTVQVAGEFIANIVRNANNNWLIWKMKTRSL